MTDMKRLREECEELQRKVGKARIELAYLEQAWLAKMIELQTAEPQIEVRS